MNNQLFERVVIVEIGVKGERARQLRGLDVRFDVSQTLAKTPNKGKIEVYNLTRESAAIADRPHSQVRLIAGYEGQEEVVFYGDINPKTSKTELEGVDYVTRMDVADGIDNYTASFTEQTFAQGTPFRQILASVGAQLSGGASPMLLDIPEDTVIGGLTLSGPSHKAMDDITKQLGLSWSVQDGVVQVLKSGGKTTNEAVLLSPETGLVGIPKRKGSNIEINSLLQPKLRPGRMIELRSRLINGTYIAQKVQHKGGSAEKEFYSIVEAKKL